MVPMGLTSLKVRLSNPRDRRRAVEEELLVDSGAIYSIVPAGVLRQIGVAPDSAREEVVLASIAPASEGETNLDGDRDEAPEAQGDPDRKPQAASREPDRSVVPDLTGLPARSAVRKLAEAALEPVLRGSGRTVAQSPRAGAIVKRGARVRVTLAPSG